MNAPFKNHLPKFILILLCFTQILAFSVAIISETKAASSPSYQPFFYTFINYTSDSNQMAISKDGKYLAISEYHFHSDSANAYLFKTEQAQIPITNDPIYTYTLNSVDFGWRSLALSGDGSTLVLGSDQNNRTLYCINTTSGDVIWKYEKKSTSNWDEIAVSEDGSQIFVGGNGIVYAFKKDNNQTLWIYNASTIISPIFSQFRGIALSEDADYLAVILYDVTESYLFLLNKTNGFLFWSYTFSEPIGSVDISRDGEIIAVGGYNGVLYVFNKNSNSTLFTWTTSELISDVSITPDGNYIAAGSYSNQLRVFTKSGTAILEKTLNDKITTVDISSDGKWLIAGTILGDLYLYEVNPEGSDDLLLDLFIDNCRINVAIFGGTASIFGFLTENGIAMIYQEQPTIPSPSILSNIMLFIAMGFGLSTLGLAIALGITIAKGKKRGN